METAVNESKWIHKQAKPTSKPLPKQKRNRETAVYCFYPTKAGTVSTPDSMVLVTALVNNVIPEREPNKTKQYNILYLPRKGTKEKSFSWGWI